MNCLANRSAGRARHVIDNPFVTLVLPAPEPGIDDRLVFLHRVPHQLHRQAVDAAEREGKTVSALAREALEQYLRRG